MHNIDGSGLDEVTAATFPPFFGINALATGKQRQTSCTLMVACLEPLLLRCCRERLPSLISGHVLISLNLYQIQRLGRFLMLSVLAGSHGMN